MPDAPTPGSQNAPSDAASVVQRITASMEDYLKAVYRLEHDGTPVTTQRLADELRFSGPSVTNMVKRLAELRLLTHNPYHGVQLTQAGQQVALEVVRHHRLLELYLSEALGFDWDQVHAEAERLEHHVSEELEARMERVLGFPEFDPHGDPIPSRSGELPGRRDILLVDLEIGRIAEVARVSDRYPEHLRFLGEMGLKPGIVLRMLEKMPFGGPVRVAIEGTEHLVPLSVAETVRVGESG
ncbi:MAG: metal-dependent transcriptional regulator [Thermomicrobiales bacterium]